MLLSSVRYYAIVYSLQYTIANISFQGEMSSLNLYHEELPWCTFLFTAPLDVTQDKIAGASSTSKNVRRAPACLF